jgi:hypothetical protein
MAKASARWADRRKHSLVSVTGETGIGDDFAQIGVNDVKLARMRSMTGRYQAKAAAVAQADHNETVMAALLDALCSPQLYEITLRSGELLIKPRPGMHFRPMT